MKYLQNIEKNETVKIATLVLLSILILLNSFKKNGTVSCKNYLANTYLYLILGILIIGYVSEKSVKYVKDYKKYYFWVSFILTLVSIVVFHLIPNENVIVGHFIWIFILSLLGFMIFPLLSMSSKSLIYESLMITMIIFIVMTLFSFFLYKYYRLSDSLLKKMGLGLFLSLLAIILVEVVFILSEYPRKIHRVISYFVIFLFILFLVYDTSSIIKRSKECVENPKSINYPNYPKESLNLILDVLNIFVRLLGLDK